jgi:hypothetical protein
LEQRLRSISLLTRSPQHPTSLSAFQNPSSVKHSASGLYFLVTLTDDHTTLILQLQGATKSTGDCTAVMHALEHELEGKYIYID